MTWLKQSIARAILASVSIAHSKSNKSVILMEKVLGWLTLDLLQKSKMHPLGPPKLWGEA